MLSFMCVCLCGEVGNERKVFEGLLKGGGDGGGFGLQKKGKEGGVGRGWQLQ